MLGRSPMEVIAAEYAKASLPTATPGLDPPFDGAGFMKIDAGESAADLGEMLYATAERMKTSMFDLDIAPAQVIPKPSVYQFDSAIGDAMFDGEKVDAAPAWKVITCQGQIIKSSTRDTTEYIPTETNKLSTDKEYNIPQLDIDLYYKRIVGPPQSPLLADEIQVALNETAPFIDGNVIR